MRLHEENRKTVNAIQRTPTICLNVFKLAKLYTYKDLRKSLEHLANIREREYRYVKVYTIHLVMKSILKSLFLYTLYSRDKCFVYHTVVCVLALTPTPAVSLIKNLTFRGAFVQTAS